MIAETAALTTYAKPNKAVERTGKKLALFSSRSPLTFGFCIFLVLSHVAYYLTARYSCGMHVISRKTLRRFWEQHPDSESALVRWFKIMQRHDFTSLETLRATFPTADKVGDFIVFNIGGNKYRLITAIHFNRRKVYIRHVLTHQEYARGAWKT